MLKLKKLLCKTLTCFIFPERLRKNVKNFLFYFSFADYIRFKKQNFHIVSLGCDCLPRVLTTAIKLKPRKIYGEKTLPFDLKYSFDLERTAELIIISNPDIYVIVQDFKINDGTWIKSFINDYGNIDNDYSRFCKNTGKKLKHIINYNT